jgi:L,D-transpeptidase catalytic domain
MRFFVCTIKHCHKTIYRQPNLYKSKLVQEKPFMHKPLHITLGVLLASLFLNFSTKPITGWVVHQPMIINVPVIKKVSAADELFSKFSSIGLSRSAFTMAYSGYEQLLKKGTISKSKIITVIDFTKSSTQKRLFILDVVTGKLLLSCLVAHGKNSGQEYATSFSNENESNKSSLGFYTTGNTYIGEHGYSLKLMGCERGINDAAYQRAIVLHGASYVSSDIIKAQGFLGRSFGCPAVPENVCKKIIEIIKNGSCLFIYHSKYKSKIIR